MRRNIIRNIIYKIFLFFYYLHLLIIYAFSCTNQSNNLKLYKSNIKNTYQLFKRDSIKYKYEDSVYIGEIKDVDIFCEYILISDVRHKKVWVFSKNLNLIKEIGREGRGPGEFSFAPTILVKDSLLILIDFTSKRLSFYNNKLQFLSTTSFVSEKIITPAKPIYFKGKYLFSTPGNSSNRESLFNDNGSILIYNEHFQYEKEFLEFDDLYHDLDRKTYNIFNSLTLMCKGKHATFYAQQQGVNKIYHVDSNYTIFQTFEFFPKYFKDDIPNTKFEVVIQSLESRGEYFSQITQFDKIIYDHVNNFLFLFYLNPTEKFWTELTRFGATHYLMVFDKEYNVILDQKINGVLAFIDKGKIYILPKESPDILKFDIYEINKK